MGSGNATNGLQECMFGQAKPSGATWSVIVGFNIAQSAALFNYSGFGIFIDDGTAKNVAWEFTQQNSSASVQISCTHWTNTTTAATANATGFYQGASSVAGWYGLIFMGVYYDGTNFNFYFSPDGQVWQKLYSESATTFIASFTNVGLEIRADNAGTTNQVNANVFHWLTGSGNLFVPGE